jgi:predicted esterase
MSRRRALRSLALAAALAASGACSTTEPGPNASGSRLAARPGTPTGTIDTGLTPLVGASGVQYGLLYVPPGYDPVRPRPLVLALHGASGTAEGPINLLRSYAEADTFLVLAIDSRGSTWDAILGAYGNDVGVIDYYLAWVFDHCAVAADRVYIEGFSDGATYALGLGLNNGDLFHRAIAFSPGFIPPYDLHGTPAVFISHGRQDPVLPIDQTSRRIVPELRGRGLSVEYLEFDGGHQVPGEIALAAITWLLAP